MKLIKNDVIRFIHFVITHSSNFKKANTNFKDFTLKLCIHCSKFCANECEKINLPPPATAITLGNSAHCLPHVSPTNPMCVVSVYCFVFLLQFPIQNCYCHSLKIVSLKK